MKIYLLQVECIFEEKEHYENVYLTKEKAIKEGKEWLEKVFREQYKSIFDEDEKDNIPKLTHEQLFKQKAIYDFNVTEFYPEIEEPLKIIHNYDYDGNEIYISRNYKGQRKEKNIVMRYEDYINKNAGTKFKIGDIVKIKNCDRNYDFKDKLHVITGVPHKEKGQEFFRNTYDVIVNHNSYDEGCHVDAFNENELELYTQKLPKDSPLIFLSKYFKEEIKLKNIKWTDIECGNITLNENKSFRDIEEIMRQMRIEGKK